MVIVLSPTPPLVTPTPAVAILVLGKRVCSFLTESMAGSTLAVFLCMWVLASATKRGTRAGSNQAQQRRRGGDDRRQTRDLSRHDSRWMPWDKWHKTGGDDWRQSGELSRDDSRWMPWHKWHKTGGDDWRQSGELSRDDPRWMPRFEGGSGAPSRQWQVIIIIVT